MRESLRSWLPTVVCCLLLMPAFHSPTLGTDEDLWTELRARLELLWTGARSERIEAANEACEGFKALNLDPIYGTPRAWTMIDALSRFANGTRDAWVADRLAESLADCEGTLWSPIFLGLLEHPSPNLRWRAVKYFTKDWEPRAKEPLERIWTSETRPWVQRDLIEALSLHGSGVHAAALQSLARSDDPMLASAAISATAELKPDHALRWLVELASQKENPLRCDALDALTEWPDSTAALQVLLVASRDEDPDIRRDAVASLGKYSDAAAVERLLEVLRWKDESNNVREAALRGVADADHSDVDSILLQMLDEPETLFNVDLRRQTEYALEDRGILELSAPRSERYWTVRLSCLNFSDGRDWRVNAPAERKSLRCWGGPKVPGDPEINWRIPDGVRVEIRDHFNSGREHWVQIGYDWDCWVLFDVLEPMIQDADRDALMYELDPFKRELDLPVDELGSRAAQELLAGGFLDVLEADDTLATVVLELDASSRDAIRHFLGAYVCERTALDDHLWDTLDALDDMYEDNPKLGPLIEAALKQLPQ